MKLKLPLLFSAVTMVLTGAGMPSAVAQMVNKTISNGLRIVVVEDHAAPAVFLRVILPCGENEDPAGKAGLADLAADLALKGAGPRTADELAELVDGLGAELVGESGDEFTVRGCNALAAHLDTALDLTRDIVLTPRLDKHEFDLVKNQMIAGIKAQRSNPSYLAAIALAPAVFGPDAPQGNVKTEESIKAITIDDVRGFHARSLQGAGAIALCIGDVDAKTVADRIERAFRGLLPGVTPKLPIEVPANRAAGQVLEVAKDELTQTTALLGKPCPGRLSPDYYSTLVANYVLGAGGFVSRLMAAVRAKEGKTYGIRSGIVSTATPNLFDIKFSTRNEELISSLQLTLEVMKDFAEKGPTDTEVEEAKEFYKGNFILQTETPAQRASKMLAYLFYGLGLDELDHYTDRIEAVTRQSAHAAAQRYLTPDHLTYCLVGPKAATHAAKEFLKNVQNSR